MEITGKLKEIFEAQEFKSGFTKREFVVTTQEQYPQDIKLELYNDKCSLIDSFSKGQEIKVEFNLRGNEFNGRYFVNLNAWRISNEQPGDKGGSPAPGDLPPPPAPSDAPEDTDDSDDLPF